MTTVQLGYDKREVRTNGIWRKGIALSRGVGKSSYNKGNGENSNNSLALYGTWLGNKGHYLDLIAKGSRLHSDPKLTASLRTAAAAKTGRQV